MIRAASTSSSGFARLDRAQGSADRDVSVRPFGRKNAHLRIARTADCEREHQSKHQRSTALNYISVSLVAYRPIERRPLAIPLLPRQAASDHLRIFAGIDLDKRPARIALRVGDL
jgi:hypothetical protein